MNDEEIKKLIEGDNTGVPTGILEETLLEKVSRTTNKLYEEQQKLYWENTMKPNILLERLIASGNDEIWQT